MRTILNRTIGFSRHLFASERFTPDAERDIFLVTYPRSGATWISCVAAELILGISPKNLTEIDTLVPDLHTLPKKTAVPEAKQYVIKSHLPLNGPPPFGEYRRVIYLIRDPRDVLLSYHRYSRFLWNYAGDLKEFATDMVAGRIWPCSWQEHVNSWLAPRFRERPFELTLLRYEDFVANPAGQIAALAEVLGVDPGPARFREIEADTNPASMRERERKGNNGIGPELTFVGPAKAGNWKQLESRDDRDAISIVEEFAHETMNRVGYASATLT